jgi:chromosome segregation protein
VRLKSLEIKGFKSFADKTTLHFDEGITGVIGPNGCGKSNIVDAIRWVIGEHKISNLRSENLESLVFNGSATRSASGLAEVSLTFENNRNLLPTEFGMVTVTRKFYKSGESEYRLNDVQCRLKDIHNLFMDTGISTDSYAIIELGMVDDIIKDKENSRRRMLEQAAGISIYKTRKKEARSKLDATESDLNRIEDLLFEINNQLKQLESQAKKAEKYFEIRKEYKFNNIELAKANIEDFQIVFKEVTDLQESATDRKFQIEAQIALEDAAIEVQKNQFVSFEKDLQTLQAAYHQIVNTVRTKEEEKNLATQRLQYIREKESSLQQFLQKSDEQLKGIEESMAFTKSQITEESSILEDIQYKLESTQDAVEDKRIVFEEKKQIIEDLRKQHQAIQRQQFEAEKNVAVSDSSIQNIQRAALQLTNEQASRKDQMEQVLIEKENKEAEIEDKRIELRELTEKQDAIKSQMLQTQSQIDQLRTNLADENRKLDAKRNEQALLKSLIDSMEGYPESVKFLHNNPNWNKNAPILSDIIYVKEQFRAALENVLDKYLNYYVVNDLEDGMKAVYLLDGSQKGKANFFLLDKLNGLPQQHDLQTIPGTIPALEVVEYDKKYANLLHFLLGNVFIAENDQALLNSNDQVVIEKNGKYVKGKYSLSGGSVGLFEGKKIGRAKNLEKLQEDILLQEAVVNELKAKIQTRSNEVSILGNQINETQIKASEQLINKLVTQAYALQNKWENQQSQQENSNNRIEDLQNQLQQHIDSISSVKDLLEKYTTQLDNLEDQLHGVEQEFAIADQEYKFSMASFNEVNLQLTRQQSKISSLQQEAQFKNKQLTDLQQQIVNSKQQFDDSSNAIAATAGELETIAQALLLLLQQKETSEKLVNEADQSFYNMRNSLVLKENELKVKIKEKDAAEQQLNTYKDQINELKLQLTSIKERLNVEFRINIDDIFEEERKSELSKDELQAICDRLKKRIENIGEVNPTAIEAYQEMKKRYDFIMEQKDDLVSAKDSLLQTIQEVEETANKKFLDTFIQVRENFQTVFKALFTDDDTADMIMEDPTNLAETGIDIVAKPKGKRPTSITQLSGGEKTLTATALLFAIYLIKPAPFCILDEVDAPLDDANVHKFTKMIRQFSKTSQFIIVTHNKMTMSTVDIIYGVTMQEAGVSKLVPVDFRNLA